MCFPPVAHMLAVSGNLVLALMDLHHVPSARSSASALELSCHLADPLLRPLPSLL